jgi:hypothetical protein
VGAALHRFAPRGQSVGVGQLIDNAGAFAPAFDVDAVRFPHAFPFLSEYLGARARDLCVVLRCHAGYSNGTDDFTVLY